LKQQAADLRKAIRDARVEVGQLKQQLDEIRKQDDDAFYLPDASRNAAVTQNVQTKFKCRRTCRGHFGKVYAMHWAEDEARLFVSASQDGKLIIWNAFTANKIGAITLRSSWVMTCAYAPSAEFIACGGLDNVCSIYKADLQADADNLIGDKPQNPQIELTQHEGYLSCARFIDNSRIVTCSGDSTCIVWDIKTRTPITIFSDHTADVMSLSVSKDGNVFVSGSVDDTAKYWDVRAGKCVGTFPGHESDINSVKLLPDDKSFVTGSDDTTCRLFDVRSQRQLNLFSHDAILCGITSVDVSLSGKYMFAGYDDYNCTVWDTLTGLPCQHLVGHENRVSCLGVSTDGQALATGSWDTFLRIWA
jgi:guanine nucleotide-binding protein G(I)/G(S)/G(T) subunit beta-1